MTSIMTPGITMFARLRSDAPGSDGGPRTVDLLERKHDRKRQPKQA